MTDINKEEMFGNLKSFLKSKGIEIQEGSYANGIRKGCEILTDTVNMSQRALDRAKDAVDKGWEQVRQTVHEKTAPKSKSSGAPKKPASNAKARTTKTASAKAKTHAPKARKRGK